MRRPIKVFEFESAPKYLQELSRNGGDEDWLAVVPPEYADVWVCWLEEPHFGCCCVDRHPHPRLAGWTVYIGCHA